MLHLIKFGDFFPFRKIITNYSNGLRINIQICNYSKIQYRIASIIIFFCFQINQLVVDESHSHGDIVIENFQESYINLTVKSMMLVKFVAQSKINAEFIFKVRQLPIQIVCDTFD